MADALVTARPDRYTANPLKRTRVGKIFVDYLRNQRGGSAICNYSTRAKPGAPVATPLRWDELKRLEGGAPYTVKTLPARLKRLKGDPWEGYLLHPPVDHGKGHEGARSRLRPRAGDAVPFLCRAPYNRIHPSNNRKEVIQCLIVIARGLRVVRPGCSPLVRSRRRDAFRSGPRATAADNGRAAPRRAALLFAQNLGS